MVDRVQPTALDDERGVQHRERVALEQRHQAGRRAAQRVDDGDAAPHRNGFGPGDAAAADGLGGGEFAAGDAAVDRGAVEGGLAGDVADLEESTGRR